MVTDIFGMSEYRWNYSTIIKVTKLSKDLPKICGSGIIVDFRGACSLPTSTKRYNNILQTHLGRSSVFETFMFLDYFSDSACF